MKYQTLLDSVDEVSTAAGMVVRLGKEFTSPGVNEIVTSIEPRVTKILGQAPVLHQLHVGYSTLLYFTFKVYVMTTN